MCGRREEAPETQNDRFERSVGVTEARDDDHAEAQQEKRCGARMAMVMNVGSCVANDANRRRDPDNQPFEPFIREVTQAENR